jgi:hypothetical protein
VREKREQSSFSYWAIKDNVSLRLFWRHPHNNTGTRRYYPDLMVMTAAVDMKPTLTIIKAEKMDGKSPHPTRVIGLDTSVSFSLYCF